MKLSRKNLGRVATTFLATAMLASLTAVPAMALENPDNDKGQYIGGTFKIAKHLTLAEDTFAPAQTFTFNITVGTADNNEKAKGIEDGVPGAVPASATATIAANATPDDNNIVDALTSELKVVLGEGGITNAGSYKYTITEADTAEEGATVYDEVTYDTSTLTMYVHVKNVKKTEENTLGLEVDFVELFDATKAEEADKGKTDGFNNEYGTKPDDDKLYNVELTKAITGDGANMNAEFGFSVTVNSEYDNSKYLVIDLNGNGQPDHNEGEVQDTWIELKDGVAYTELKLGHEDSAFIVGLTNGDSYTIAETDAGSGYTTTAAYEGGNAITLDQNRQFTGTALTKDETVIYTNTKIAVTPTGIAMDIAPYALLVVIAAAGCFVFLRKRNED